jgi:hypothetical protein
MCRYNQLPSVQEFGPGEIVKEKIDGMDVHNIRIFDEFDYGRSKRIPRRAEKRQSNYFRTVNHFARRQHLILRCFEHAVQRHDAHAMAGGDLRRGQFTDDTLDSAESRMELTHNMDNIHGGIPH